MSTVFAAISSSCSPSYVFNPLPSVTRHGEKLGYWVIFWMFLVAVSVTKRTGHVAITPAIDYYGVFFFFFFCFIFVWSKNITVYAFRLAIRVTKDGEIDGR